MIFRQFDLSKSLPFSQGYAINELANGYPGKLLEAAEVAEQTDYVGTLLYIKMESDNVAESIWQDNGCELKCLWHRIDNGPWMHRETPKRKWREVEFEVVYEEREEVSS